MITIRKTETTAKKNYPELEIKFNGKKPLQITDNLWHRFKEKLKILYWTEKAIHKAIPGMMRNAKSEELVEALEFQRLVNREQLIRIEAVFALIQTVPETQENDVIESLIKDAVKILRSNRGMIRDAEAISIIQQIQHLEIALYGTLCSFARTLGEEIILVLLEDSLNEEKQSDKNLSLVAEVFVNPVAAYGYPLRTAGDDTLDVCILTKKYSQY